MKEKSTKLKKNIFKAVCLVIILLLLTVIALQIFLPHKVLEVFGVSIYLISYTGSMEPMLNYNDLIVVKKYDFAEVQEGDVITFLARTTDGKTLAVTHTVQAVFYDNDTGIKYLRTKGINNPRPDTVPVTKDGVDDTNIYLGKYAHKNELVGNIIGFFRSVQGIATIVINVLMLTLIYVMLKGLKKRAEQASVSATPEVKKLSKLEREYTTIVEGYLIEERARILEREKSKRELFK